MERLEQHRLSPPLDALGWWPRPSAPSRGGPADLCAAVLGELDDLREAVDCLETYQAFQPEPLDRGDINRQLLAWGRRRRRAMQVKVQVVTITTRARKSPRTSPVWNAKS